MKKATGLIIFGIILLAIGSFALYFTLKSYDDFYKNRGYYPVQCPLCNGGTVLIVAGIVLVALGLLYPSWWETPPPTYPSLDRRQTYEGF